MPAGPNPLALPPAPISTCPTLARPNPGDALCTWVWRLHQIPANGSPAHAPPLPPGPPAKPTSLKPNPAWPASPARLAWPISLGSSRLAASPGPPGLVHLAEAHPPPAPAGSFNPDPLCLPGASPRASTRPIPRCHPLQAMPQGNPAPPNHPRAGPTPPKPSPPGPPRRSAIPPSPTPAWHPTWPPPEPSPTEGDSTEARPHVSRRPIPDPHSAASPHPTRPHINPMPPRQAPSTRPKGEFSVPRHVAHQPPC